MLIDRRRFLVGSMLSFATAPHAVAEALTGSETADFISACHHANGGYALALLTREGRILREIPLSARGHDIAIDKASGRAVAFARRPGYFAVAFDLASRTEPHVFALLVTTGKGIEDEITGRMR